MYIDNNTFRKRSKKKPSTQKPVESTVDGKTFNVSPGRLPTMRNSDLANAFSQQPQTYASQPVFSLAPDLVRKRWSKKNGKISFRCDTNGSHMRQRNSTAETHYVETRDEPSSPTDAEYHLVAEQLSEPHNANQIRQREAHVQEMGKPNDGVLHSASSHETIVTSNDSNTQYIKEAHFSPILLSAPASKILDDAGGEVRYHMLNQICPTCPNAQLNDSTTPLLAMPLFTPGSRIDAKNFARKTPSDNNFIPTLAYSTRFDFTLQVREGNKFDDNVKLALMQIFQKVKAVDGHAVMYPWIAGNFLNGDSIINDPDAFPTSSSIRKQYIHRLVQLPNGSTYHGKMYMGLTVPLQYLLENLQKWLQRTNQEMRMTTLKDAKSTVCLGWLLYSAVEYKRDALQHEIKRITGVDVELRYRQIDGGPHGMLQYPQDFPKALHLEVNRMDSDNSQKVIAKIYSSASNTFPLGIQMHLVPEYRVLTNRRSHNMFRQLCDIQQDFLARTKTCITQAIPTLNLDGMEHNVNLRSLLMSIPDPCKPASKLFYAVNNRGSEEGIIFRFYPQKSTAVCAVVAQISKMVHMTQICNNIPATTYMPFTNVAIISPTNERNK